MLVTLSRIIKYGVQGFLRNSWLSASTIIIMILALLVFEGLIIFNVVAKNTISSLQQKIDISVYFKSNASEDDVLNLKKSLEGLNEVKSVEYISQEKALEDFKIRHASEETITQTLEELDKNPLLASLNIKAQDPSQYGAIADYLSNQSLQNLIEKVSYAQHQVVIERLTAIVGTMKKGGIALTVFLALLAIIVTFNTIRLAIYSNSEQIGIMRLVGASNSFIRGPYVVEGIIYGVISGLLSFLIWIPILNVISPHISNFVAEVNLKLFLNTNFLILFVYQLAFGIILGIISSVVAVRRYLRI